MSLVLLANRAPIRPTEDGWVPGLGGLATALLPVLEERGGAWIAMREPDEDAPLTQPYPEADPRFTVHRVPLDAEAFEGYYNGMANRVLWPLSHYLVDHAEPDRVFWETYQAVNERFAEAALEAARGDARFWVQDYHLMLVPEKLRAARPDAPIGHFWHIPWPAPEVLRILPSARPLLRGMLGADLVGFHTEGYAENFRESARDLLGADIDGTTIHWEGRTIRAEAFPIGIDAARFEAMGVSEETARDAERLREAIGAELLVAAVDRLDYTKGLLLRLDAFEAFLHRYPEMHGRVALVQIATPSRTGIETYDQLKREVDEAVGRINGAFSEGNWEPIRYRYRAFDQAELAVLYRAADVAFVTPLRDGMNLVAHEFAAASRLERPGALVLSELTGAADYLDGAITANPYDTEGLALALYEALTLDAEARAQRLARMKAAVRRLDVHGWADRFLKALERARPASTREVGGDGQAAAVPSVIPVAA